MNKFKNLLKVVGEIAALFLLLALLFAIFQAFVPGASPSGQPVTSTSASQEPAAYPPPGPIPSPIASPTAFKPAPAHRPTWTSYPTNTARPGPTPTPIPLVGPAKDADGTIFFFSPKDYLVKNFYTLAVDQSLNIAIPLKETVITDVPDGTYYVSPNGKKVAIVGNWGTGGILDILTGKFEPFTQNLGRIQFLNWFPDNQHVLVADDFHNLLLADLTGGNYVPLFGSPSAGISGAAASPDGRYVIYSYEAGFEAKGIWIVDSDGRNARLLADGLATSFAWSPDGKSIAFWGWGLEIMNMDGSNRRRIKEDYSFPQCYFLPPVWSPDSTKLAFVSNKTDAFCDEIWNGKIGLDANIYLVDVIKNESRLLLSDGSSGNWDPAWSPDGTQLVFVSSRDGNPNIWVVNTDGQNLRQLTKDQANIRFPFWVKP